MMSIESVSAESGRIEGLGTYMMVESLNFSIVGHLATKISRRGHDTMLLVCLNAMWT